MVEANPSQVKSAWIAALATILAAVIGAGALILVNSHRNQESQHQEIAALQHEATTLRGELEQKTKEVNTLSASLATKRNQPAPGQLTAGPGATDSASLATTTGDDNGFVLVLDRCVRAGPAVTCSMTFRNTGVERRLMIELGDGNTHALDDQGIQRVAPEGEVAGVHGDWPSVVVPSGLTVPVKIRFRDIPGSVKQFAFMNVQFSHSDGNGGHHIELRSIPIVN